MTRFETVAAICRRWLRRYRREGFGIVKRPTSPRTTARRRQPSARYGEACQKQRKRHTFP